MKTNPDQMFVATTSFATTIDGTRYMVRANKTRVRAGHVLLKGRETFFKPVEEELAAFETATAVPGEKRERVTPPAPSKKRTPPRRKKK
jgi:hypothetical protein